MAFGTPQSPQSQAPGPGQAQPGPGGSKVTGLDAGAAFATPSAPKEATGGRIEPQGTSAVVPIRIMALIVLIAAVGIQFAIGTLGNGINFEDTNQILSLVFGIAAIGTGFVGIWLKLGLSVGERHLFSMKDVMLSASIVCLILSAAFGPVLGREFIEASTVDIGTLLGMLLKILVFAIMFLWYIELAHATVRFDEMEQFVLHWGIKDFQIKDVQRSYYVWSGIIVPVVFGITFGVLALSKGLFSFAPPVISTSVEFNSIYGIAAVTALVFVPLAIVLNFVFGWEGYQKATRAVFKKGEEEDEEEGAVEEIL